MGGSTPSSIQQHARNLGRIMEKDHSIKTVQSKGASISHASGGKIPYDHEIHSFMSIMLMAAQLPKARMVSSWRMVRSAGKLEGKYSNYGRGYNWHNGNGVEHKCRARRADKVPGGGAVLPKSVVSASSWKVFLFCRTDIGIDSWSKQIIEHERAKKGQ